MAVNISDDSGVAMVTARAHGHLGQAAGSQVWSRRQGSGLEEKLWHH